MPAKKLNPITEKLLRMIQTGKTTKERICVAADLKYPTFMNIFNRSKISYVTLKSLRLNDIITEKDELDYRKWLLENDSKNKKKKEIYANNTENKLNQSEEHIEDLEGHDDEEV